MRAVVQRVKQTSVFVDGNLVSSIDFGLAVFLGIGIGDSLLQAERLAYKIANLRIFEDERGKMNLSVKDVGGEILLVSQFTLYGDCSHGNRPNFSYAEAPDKARVLYEHCAKLLRRYDITVKQGVFGADMKISQYNDGPVSIILEI